MNLIKVLLFRRASNSGKKEKEDISTWNSQLCKKVKKDPDYYTREVENYFFAVDFHLLLIMLKGRQ